MKVVKNLVKDSLARKYNIGRNQKSERHPAAIRFPVLTT